MHLPSLAGLTRAGGRLAFSDREALSRQVGVVRIDVATCIQTCLQEVCLEGAVLMCRRRRRVQRLDQLRDDVVQRLIAANPSHDGDDVVVPVDVDDV